ncbi:MAG: hypothetical protein WB611_27520 [Stellaceae bacterium]
MSPDALAVTELEECSVPAPQPWLVPKGWSWAQLRLFLAGAGKSIDPRRRPTSKFVLYSVPAFDNRRPEEILGTDIGSAKRQVDPGSVLLCRINPRINRSWFVSKHEQYPDSVIASTEWVVFPPHPVLDPKYLIYFLSTERIRQYLSANVSGVGGSLMRVSAYTIGTAAIPIAPLPEQRRIVARIDELFAEIAEGEAALQRARQGLDTWRRALLKAAVTGELTRDWREANRPAETGADLLARIRAERGSSAPRSSRTRRSAASGTPDATSPPVLPDGWAWTTLGECISHLTSSSRDWSQYYDQGSAVFIMAQNIRPGRYDHSYVKHVAPPVGDAEATRTRVRKNDLLVTIVGANTGDVCRVDFKSNDYFVCQSVALVRPILREMSEFFELYFVAPDGGRGEFEKVIYGAGRPHLSFNQLLETRVPIPSLLEMGEIVQRAREQQEAAFSEQELAQFHRDLLALRQSTLRAAFEGRLVQQNPMDEPASELLARLRNNYRSNGARRPRARPAAGSSHPSLPGLTRQSVDPRIEPAGEE